MRAIRKCNEKGVGELVKPKMEDKYENLVKDQMSSGKWGKVKEGATNQELTEIIVKNLVELGVGTADEIRQMLTETAANTMSLDPVYIPLDKSLDKQTCYLEESKAALFNKLHECLDLPDDVNATMKQIQKLVQHSFKLLDTWPELEIGLVLVGKKGKAVKRYVSLEGVEKDGFNAKSVEKCISGIHKTHKGYKWEWISKEEGEPDG